MAPVAHEDVGVVDSAVEEPSAAPEVAMLYHSLAWTTTLVGVPPEKVKLTLRTPALAFSAKNAARDMNPAVPDLIGPAV